ncbi:MAG: hypothetical protein H0T42_21165 [Deltaproteobacteria bacterium]|nr:hypothetical protein [Deltaproteobacteria bacterium]
MLVALTACGQAGAQPSAASGLTPPAGWIAIPEIATAAATAAKGDGVTVDGAEAWGDPARGCYGVWLALHGAGISAEQVLAGLASQPITTRDVVKPESGDGIIALGFETTAAPGSTVRGSYRGRLRARIAAGKITALACFANEREPSACAGACTTLLGGLP